MINSKLLKLSRAMIEFEGWQYPDPQKRGFEFGSASWRNHNPGNLRASPFQIGTQNNFAVFVDDQIGFFALVWDLWKKARGETSTKLTGKSTIHDLVKIYSAENPEIVLKYVRFVEQKTGFSATMKLEELLK